MVTLLTSLGSSLQLGYNHWVVNYPASFIQDFYNVTYQQKKKAKLEDTLLNLMNNLTVAVYSLGGIIGSLLACPLVDKRGRRGTLIISNCLSVISAILLGFTTMVNAYEYIIFSHLITGVCSGIFFSAIPLYLGEVAPRNQRGSIITTSFFFVAIGTLISQILCLPEVLGSIKDWPILLSCTGILALFQIITLPTFPESPRYLLIQKKDEEKARTALKQLRCQGNVEEEIDELYQEDYSERTEKSMSIFKLVLYRGMRWQVVSVIIVICGRQLTGIIAVRRALSEEMLLQYINFAFLDYNLHDLRHNHCIFLIDRVGRKILLLSGFGVSSILSILLTMTLELQITIKWMPYVSLSLLLIFLMGFTLGPGPVSQIITIELFLQSSRSAGVTIGGLLYWLLTFLTEIIFKLVETRIGSYSFLFFWPICISTFIFIFKFLPETKNKTFLEIRRYMSNYMTKKIKVHEKQSKNRSLPKDFPGREGKLN
uniref:Major facilitator superfamily (MFS) profile domain-containing protein n=1 Tax=Salvator merianae TaxID=96440 RepID=A0A8D0BTD1_SALMN